MTEYDASNNNFYEKYLGEKAITVTNNLGRTVEINELVYLGGYFGNALEEIANGATGKICIDNDREIYTEQVEATDTFTVGGVMYFVPGGSSAQGKLTDAAGSTGVAVGTITAEEGTAGAQTSVTFRPYLQKADLSGLDTRMTALEVDAATGSATIPIPLAAITQEDGTPLGKLNTTTSGFAQLADKEQVIDIPINATIEAFGFTTPVPQDLDDTEDITVHVLAGKSANLDELTLDCEVYPCAVGDTANADIQDTAAQTITQAASELVFTCGADGVLAAPGTLTVILTLGGTNDGDAVYLYGAWIEYTKKIMTA
jgi:predicted RecA/RadA family phage recombinase